MSEITKENVDAERARRLAALADLIERFNAQYAVVNEAGKVWVFESVDDPMLERKVLVRISFADFKKMYQNTSLTVLKVKKGKTGSEEVTEVSQSQAEWWLNHRERRQFLKGVVFDPTERFGPPHYWNLWQGWPIPPAPGDWSLMRQHIMGVVCTGNQQHYDYVICWMATMVQRPNVQGKV